MITSHWTSLSSLLLPPESWLSPIPLRPPPQLCWSSPRTAWASYLLLEHLASTISKIVTSYFVDISISGLDLCLCVSYLTLALADNSTILKHSAVSATHNWFCFTKRRSATKSQLSHVHFYVDVDVLDSAWAEIPDIIPCNEFEVLLSHTHSPLGMGQVKVVIPKTTKEKELLHDWRANKKLNSECFD